MSISCRVMLEKKNRISDTYAPNYKAKLEKYMCRILQAVHGGKIILTKRFVGSTKIKKPQRDRSESNLTYPICG